MKKCVVHAGEHTPTHTHLDLPVQSGVVSWPEDGGLDLTETLLHPSLSFLVSFLFPTIMLSVF